MSKRVFLLEIQPLIIQQLENEGSIVFAITGNSMTPMLYHKRDRVCIVKFQKDLIKKYDILLYQRPDKKFILHRVVGIKPEGYVALGDNQVDKEFGIHHSQVIGVVKGFWRKEKYISCDNIGYHFYYRIWYLIFPLRWFYSMSYRLIRKVFKALGDRNV